MTDARVHAFTDDALSDHDAVAIADLIRKGEISAREAADAAIARAEKVEPELNAVVFAEYDRLEPSTVDGLLAGVPTYIKDNTDARGISQLRNDVARQEQASRVRSERQYRIRRR
jgi:amidase